MMEIHILITMAMMALQLVWEIETLAQLGNSLCLFLIQVPQVLLGTLGQQEGIQGHTQAFLQQDQQGQQGQQDTQFHQGYKVHPAQDHQDTQN